MAQVNEPRIPPLPPRLLLLLMLALSSALSVTLSILRIWYSGTRYYIFLNWNLMLAWVPLALAFMLWRLDRKSGHRPRLLMLVVFCSWFLFFPNSPYLVSDLMHITSRNNVPVWYDTLMIFSFAWNGLILGFVSLWIVQQLAARWFGAAFSWLFAAVVLTATGFGIYLGRFQRWNSWDVLVDPLGMAKQVLVYALNPLDYPRTLGVTLLFGGFLTIAYLTAILLPSALSKSLADGQATSRLDM
jgi:uncharacterized membrane protein